MSFATTKIQPFPRTLLPLPEYARIIGINPIHFMSGKADTVFSQVNNCTDRWLTYVWQGGHKVTRYELAEEIARAERDVAKQLGWWPAPHYITNERLQWPRHHRRSYFGNNGLNVHGEYKSLRAKWGKIISGGERAVTKIATATTAGGTLVYSDEDGDGVDETATITVSTTVTDACEIALFSAGFDGDQRFEIRPLRYVEVSGGSATISLDSWLLYNLEKLANFPGTNGFEWLDLTTANLATSVDVYRVYTDPSEGATLHWRKYPHSDVAPSYGGTVTQNAAVLPTNPDDGFFAPLPGTYDSDEESWTAQAYTGGREPDRVVLNYVSGPQEETNSYGCYIMPEDLKRAVAYIATARLARPLCDKCETLKAREEELKADLVFVQEGDTARFVRREVLTCPFGTRYGEVEAWRIVKARSADKTVEVGVG